MTCFVSTDELSGYTDLSLDETLKCLNDGAPIKLWWYSSFGSRNEETVVLTSYGYVRTADNG